MGTASFNFICFKNTTWQYQYYNIIYYFYLTILLRLLNFILYFVMEVPMKNVTLYCIVFSQKQFDV